MPTWEITVEVTRARGVQIYRCEAETAEQALEKYRNGDLECADEQLEAEELAEPEIGDVSCRS